MRKDIISKVGDEPENIACIRRTQESVRGHSMKQEPSELNSMCEAVGCFTKATTTIEVKVGQRGTILLSLCHGCVSEFDDQRDLRCFKEQNNFETSGSKSRGENK